MSTYVGQLDSARFVRPKAVAGYGFALGVVAFLAAIPPLTARSPVWPALLGILAAFAGHDFRTVRQDDFHHNCCW